jgi:hypothetical protein
VKADHIGNARNVANEAGVFVTVFKISILGAIRGEKGKTGRF